MSTPNSNRAAFRLGLEAMKKLRYAEAIIIFEGIQKSEPKNMGALGNAGTCAFNLGDYKKTIALMSIILERNSSDWGATIMLAQAVLKTGDWELSAKLTKDALIINPKEQKLWSQLVSIYLLQNNLEAAEKELSNAFKNCIPSNELKLLAGLFFLEKNDTLKSKTIFHELSKLDPKTYNELHIRSVAHLRLNHWEHAFDTCSNPASPPSFLHDSFDERKKTNDYLNTLPSIKFMCNKRFAPTRTVMFAGDELYIERFFQGAADSVKESNSDCNIHLHAMLSYETNPAFLEKLVNDQTSISYEFYKPIEKTGYTTRRFVRLFQILNYLKKPILCLDIDSKVVGNLNQFFDEFLSTDIGIYRRRMEVVITQLTHAAMLYASPTAGALRFLGFFSNYVNYLESRNKLNWFADQMALLATKLWVNRFPGIVIVKQIPVEFMTWTAQQANTLVFTFKGGQKDFVDV